MSNRPDDTNNAAHHAKDRKHNWQELNAEHEQVATTQTSESSEIVKIRLQLMTLNRYRSITYINSGSFGLVYSAHDDTLPSMQSAADQQIATSLPALGEETTAIPGVADQTDSGQTLKPNCAIKVEREASSHGSSRLHSEYVILQRLYDLNAQRRSHERVTGSTKLHHVYGFPQPYSFGRVPSGRYLVMDLLGDNLAILLRKCGGTFSHKTTMMVALQAIERLRDLHSISFLHRDVKPENMVMGGRESTKSILYFVDFGLAKPFNAQRSGLYGGFHIGMAGTLRYASVYTIAGEQQSFRDDMISLTYTLSYCATGRLPWQGVKLHPRVMGASSNEGKQARKMKVLTLKRNTPLEMICKNFPAELKKITEHIHSLGFFTMPPYSMYIDLINEYFGRSGEKFDRIYDWDDKQLLADKDDGVYRIEASTRSISRIPFGTSIMAATDETKTRPSQ